MCASVCPCVYVYCLCTCVSVCARMRGRVCVFRAVFPELFVQHGIQKLTDAGADVAERGFCADGCEGQPQSQQPRAKGAPRVVGQRGGAQP